MHPNVERNLDAFKATFQKPSQIYRYLSTKWRTQPLFLQRTLSYVSKHRARKVRPHVGGIDEIAERLTKDSIMKECDKINTEKSRRNNQSTRCKRQEFGTDKVRRSSDEDIKLYFNWICIDDAKTSQKTKSFGFICPWCENDSRHLDTFMMHLKCVHFRFTYNLLEDGNYPVIEMTLNQSFDGSYCGFKFPGHDLRRDFRFAPKEPQLRQSQLLFTYFKPKRQVDNMQVDNFPDNDADLFCDDDEADVDVSGRLYYHTSTCLPIKPNECDIDSEADMDPEWLKERTQLMIDEFTDVNEGEKELLKLWNLHMMKNYKFRADNILREACLDFVRAEGATIVSRNLKKNFTLHLANLYDFGLIGSKDMMDCIRLLREIRPTSRSIVTSPVRASNRMKQEQRNEHCQHSPPAKRALLNSQLNQ